MFETLLIGLIIGGGFYLLGSAFPSWFGGGDESSGSKTKEQMDASREKNISDIKKTVSTKYHEVTWGKGRKPLQAYTDGDKPSSDWYKMNHIDERGFKNFMFIKDKYYKELRHNPIPLINQYRKWLSTVEGKFHSKIVREEILEAPKESISVTRVEQKIETTEDKLKKLKDLYDKELISKEVYEKQQLEILSK